MLQAAHLAVLTGDDLRAVEVLAQPLAENLHQEGTLAAAADAGDADELAQRDANVDFLQVVLGRAQHLQPLAVARPALLGHGDALAAAQVGSGQALVVGGHLLRRALRYQLAAVLARPRPEVDQPVGGAHRLLVVFHDQDGVAQVAHPLQGGDEPGVVALMQADARLVQHVEHAHELAADLRRQPDALRLAAAQRARRALQRQVVKADVDHEAQPLANLLQDRLGDHLLARRQRRVFGVFQAERPLQAADDRLPGHVDDSRFGHVHGAGHRLQARAVADAAWPVEHVFFQLLTYVVRGRLAVAPPQVGDDALVLGGVAACVAFAVAILHRHRLAAAAVEQDAQLLVAELAHGHVERDAEVLGRGLQQLPVVAGLVLGRPAGDGPLG